MSEEICYLCGKTIPDDVNPSCDHVISKQFIERKQPRAKGFDYGGFLPTHETCNTSFGGSDGKTESICQKALRLIQIFHSGQGVDLVSSADPSIKIFCIPNTGFEDFSERESEYFGIIDTTKMSPSAWLAPSFYDNRPPMDPMERPVNAALSVLAKNSAALLIKRNGIAKASQWIIAAKPCQTSLDNADLSPMFGIVKPFENGLRVYVLTMEGGDFFVAYQFKKMCMWFYFS